MAKKKKKNRNKKRGAGDVKPKAASVLLGEQLEALAAGRGRRASVLGEQVFTDGSVPEPERLRRLAVGHEAFLRELQAKGHTEQLKAKAEKLLKAEPRIAGFWALGFQIRLGLVDGLAACLADREWMDRLRSELVDPSDLCGVDAGGLGDQAQAVLEAWALIEKGQDAAAAEQLKGIGRRSPLVDWRLFLQVFAAMRRKDLTGAELTLERMRVGTPALAAAMALMAEQKTAKGEIFRRLKALERRVVDGSLPVSDYPRLQSVVKYLLGQKRPGLALSLAVLFGIDVEADYFAERYFSLFDRMEERFFDKARIFMRLETICSPHDGMLDPEVMADIRHTDWSESELAAVWCRVCRQVRGRWDELCEQVPSTELERIRENLFFPMLDEFPGLMKKVPHCREILEFWVWAENESERPTGQAVLAYAEAFPDDTEAVGMAVLGLADAGQDMQARKWQKHFMKLGTPEEIEALKQTLCFVHIRHAFQKGDAEAVEALARAYAGELLLECVHVAFMRWSVASRGQKRKRGEALAAFGVPWLVLFVGMRCDDDFKVSALPVGIKRALTEDPASVVRGFLELVRLDERLALAVEEECLIEFLSKALEAPEVPVDAVRDVLVLVLARSKFSEEFVWAAEGFIGAFKNMLAGSADHRALAIVLRMLAVYEAEGPVGAKKAERSFRVAWTLAEREATRRLISQVYSRCKLPHGKMNKKPATQKMIDAELKMQRRFTSLKQVSDYYFEHPSHNPFTRGGFDPFAGMDEDEIENYLEPDFDEVEAKPKPGYKPLIPPKSQPYRFSKYPPLMEFDFESMAAEIQQTTSGQHREDAAQTFEKLVAESSLSDAAKARLMEKQQNLLEGA